MRATSLALPSMLKGGTSVGTTVFSPPNQTASADLLCLPPSTLPTSEHTHKAAMCFFTSEQPGVGVLWLCKLQLLVIFAPPGPPAFVWALDRGGPESSEAGFSCACEAALWTRTLVKCLRGSGSCLCWSGQQQPAEWLKKSGLPECVTGVTWASGHKGKS